MVVSDNLEDKMTDLGIQFVVTGAIVGVLASIHEYVVPLAVRAAP